MRNRFFGALFVFMALFAANVSAGWEFYGDVTKVSETQAKTGGGKFSVGFDPDTSASKVDFFIDGDSERTELASPYWLFGDYGTYPNRLPYTQYGSNMQVTAKVTATNGAVAYYLLTITKSTTSTSSPPPAPTTSSGTNLLKNSNFLTSLTSFGWNPSSNWMISWNSAGKNDAGSLRFLKGSTPSEAWQGKWTVNPGDKIILKGWFKSGDAAANRPNKGVGIGVDLRNVGGGSIVYVLNGPATVSKEWQYLTTEHVIPCIGHDDEPADKWTSTDGRSGTIDGSRAGLTPNYMYLEGKKLPSTMEATLWTQIWHKDSVASGNADNLHLEIVRDVKSC